MACSKSRRLKATKSVSPSRRKGGPNNAAYSPFGTLAFDYDRDGQPDLFVTNGHLLGPKHDPCELRPQLLRNDGSGRFHDISDLAGAYFQELWLGRTTTTTATWIWLFRTWIVPAPCSATTLARTAITWGLGFPRRRGSRPSEAVWWSPSPSARRSRRLWPAAVT